MINVIPNPMYVLEKEGMVVFKSDTKVAFDKELKSVEEFFKRAFDQVTEFEILTADSLSEANIRFVYVGGLDAEEYVIDITAEGITVKAATHSGGIYAVETLKQIFHTYTTKGARTLSASVVKIKDKPRFSWRGILLDVARHFFDKEEVKRILDVMLLHKLNVLHLHLTDDQGWRLEVKKYPLLTEIGSKRKWTHINGWNSTNPYIDILKEEHSGYYTQEDIKELVEYAKERGISIVPEIDMPAHFRAALAAYPDLACDENIVRDVPWFFGGGFADYAYGDKDDLKRIACAGKESTYTFIEDIIDEIAELFPSPYFHIGGDEAPKDEWKKCYYCQEKMKENGLKDEEELQGYFNNRIAEMLAKRGKTLIVWNEALAGGNLDPSTIGQYWTPARDKNAEDYVNVKGGKLIMSKHQAFYFDMSYAQVPLRNTYAFDLTEQNIQPDGVRNILGVEGTLWSEWIADREKLEFNSHPRMAALSETGWTPTARKNYKDFMLRLQGMKKAYDALGIRYACDKVADPKNPIKKAKEIKIWYKKDQHHELKVDRELREKGEK